MHKHQLYINLLVTASALALTACADEVANVVTPTPAEGKTPIELSLGGVLSAEGSTRAVVTDGTTNTNFERDTKVFILMQSDKDAETHDGYEYQGNRNNTLYAVARADVSSSDPTKLTFDNLNQKYWDDAHARSTKLTIWAFAQRIAQSNVDGAWKTCYFQSYDGNNPSQEETKKLEFKTAEENYNFKAAATDYPAIYPAIYNFSVNNPANTQTANTLIYQDILFSNNIADYLNNENVPQPSRSDNRLKFNFSTHKFPASTELKFYHAMSKITIKIKAGFGFKADDTDFILSNNKSVDELNGFNTNGLFNIKDGEFQMIHNREQITTIPTVPQATGTSDYKYVLEALAIPNINEFMRSKRTDAYQDLKDEGSRFDENGDNVMIQFTIDGNTYKIKSGALFNALKYLEEGYGANQIHKYTDNSKTYIPMEAGKNYVFTFTIGKTKIENICATLAPWVNVVAAEETPDNAYVRLQLKNQTEDPVKGKPTFDFFRAKDLTTYNSSTPFNDWAVYDWKTGYTKADVVESTQNQGTYKASVFWEDNETFYHFRTLNRGLDEKNKGTDDKLTKTGDDIDYVTMYSGPINDTSSNDSDGNFVYDFSTLSGENKYNDYIWGAPFNKATGDHADLDNQDKTPVFPTYSFDYGYVNNATAANGQIYKAIGATKDVIFFYQFHMMSNIYVDLTTPDDASAVTLTGATVKLVNYTKSAKLQIGDAKIVGNDYDNGTGVNMTLKAADAPATTPEYDYSYRVVPQPLVYTTGGTETKVGLVITCKDKNVYTIDDLSKLKDSSNKEITDWLPGKKYYYKFNLKKTGIEMLQATIVDWENVTADNEDVTIK